MPVPEFPPEAYAFTTEEAAELCQFSTFKTLGGVLLSLVESTPAEGFDLSCGPEGMHIPMESTNHIVLHVDYIEGLQQVRHDLVRAATYMQLQPIYREYSTAMGVTYRQMANFAVRAFGFRAMKPTRIEPDFLLRLQTVYESLPMSQKEDLEPVMIYMPVSELIDRYGAKHLGTNARQLAARIAAGESIAFTPQPPESDPLLQAINDTINTMGGNSA